MPSISPKSSDSAAALRLGERVLLALKRSPNCSMFIDENGFVDFCSDKFVRLLGAKNDDDIRGKHFCEIYRLFSDSDELIDGAKKAFEEIKTKRAFQEKRLDLHFPADSSKRTYTVHSIPLISESGEFFGAKVLFVDTTQLKIEAANESARILLDKAPIGCSMRDGDNRIIDCNAEALQMFGVADREEFIRRFNEFVPERQPDGSLSADTIRDIYKGKRLIGGHAKLEWLYLNASGEPLPTETTVVLADWQGDCRYLVYSRDLRDIKSKEKTARLANDRVRAMLEATPIACVFFDGDAKAIDCNSEALRLFGTDSKEELLERFFYYAPEFQPNGEVSFDQKDKNIAIALEEGNHVFEWLHKTASGKDLPLLTTLKRIEWNGSHCLAAYMQDLSEIKAVDRNAREAEEIPLSLLDAAPIAAFLLDENLRLFDCNNAAVRAFGFASKQDLTKNFFDLLRRQTNEALTIEKIEELFNEAFSEGYGRFECEFVSKNGEPLRADAVLTRIPWHNGYRVVAYLDNLRKTA
ncbi:MAG: PAS domain-containing protein [Helicobacteraceae bacterium]|jgi:PAS domain S-box-containing protein|nr:PAS domain-containing protein [Helicobacteraceae bacterium]